MLLKFLHFLFGYLTIEVSGDYNERILNLLSYHKINIWNIEKKDENIYLTLKTKDFPKLRKIRRNIGIKIKIKDKKGFPFLLRKNRFRFGFFGGIALFFITIYVLNLFVWRIEVVGNKTVSTEEIIDLCNKIGLTVGIQKNRIDSYTMRDKLLLNSENLAWASVNIEGCVVTVNVSEIKNKPENNDICNVVSDYNAVIKNIKVQKGSAVVKNGDAVQKGDLLISGVVTQAGHSYFTDAAGEIQAEVEEKISVEVELETIEKIQSGKPHKKCALEFFNISFPLFLGREQQEYDAKFEKKSMYLFGKEMPISLYVMEVYPYKSYTYKTRPETIETQTKLRFEKIIKQRKIEDFDVSNITANYTNTHYVTTFTVKYLKNIGIKEKILF